MKKSFVLYALWGLFFSMACYELSAQQEQFVKTQIGPEYLLDKPWDINYGPDDYLWVTEREAGKVVRINPVTAERDELIAISDHHSSAGQDGLLGMAIDENLLNGSPYVYVSYTYLSQGQRRQRIARYTYSISGSDGQLSAPITLIENLPASNDHNSGRLLIGPDGYLYYSIGDQGANQSSNYCMPNLAQEIPAQSAIDQQDWSDYPGKILRIGLDGSIPADNPVIDGVQSHIYTYGHRNPQGLDFGTNGLLYSDEHGPNTDDEVNFLMGGKNYGWPRVAGYRDNQVYDYCNWSSAPDCEGLGYSSSSCHPSITLLEETTFTHPDYQEPLFPMFAVTDDYDFNNPDCSDSWICRPNVAPSSIAYYGSNAIPAWKNSLLVVSLKRGRIYRLQLNTDGTEMIGDTTHHFYTTNRYRDLAISPDGKSFYIITDESGKTSDASGYIQTTNLQNRGTILKFTLDESVATKPTPGEAGFHVFPNPVSSQLTIKMLEEGPESFQATLLNTTGIEVQHIGEIKGGQQTLEMGHLPAGIYYLKVFSSDKTGYKKIVKP